MIDIEIGIVRPELSLTIPASEDTLALVRQALRSLGETIDADVEALEDAELAVTEACANAVEHAYGEGGGEIEVHFDPGEAELRVSVSDWGVGIPVDVQSKVAGDGFGLPMIAGIATEVKFGDRGGDGTEITMALPLGRPEPPLAVDGSVPGVEPAERILRRLVAVVAAQRDMSSERVMEGLLLAELVARNALRYLVGETVSVHIDLVGDGFELSVGTLEVGGAQAVIADGEVPVVGSVLERLADDVRVESAGEGETLVLRVDPRG